MKNLRLLFLALFWCLASLSGVMGQQGNVLDLQADYYLSPQSQPQALNLDSLKKEIIYPDSCKKNNIEGKVVMKLLIGIKGQVTKHVVIKSPHPLFTQELISKVYSLRFKPSYDVEGRAVKCWVVLPFDFTIKKDEPKK